MRVAAASLTLSLALAVVGCGELIHADDYRVIPETVDSGDGWADGAATLDGADLSCLGSVKWPPPTGDTLNFTLQSAVDSNGYIYAAPGLTVHACYELTEGCQSTPGDAEQAIPAHWSFSQRDPWDRNTFFGHLATHDPSSVYFDHLLYFFPSPRVDGTANVGVWKRKDLSLALHGVTLDPNLGILAFEVYDCQSAVDPSDPGGPWSAYVLPPSGGGHVVQGVSVTVDTPEGAPEPTYFYGYPPSPDPLGHTDGNGLVFIANVAPGLRTVAATRGELPFGSRKVYVEPDRVTSFHFVPPPEQ